MGELRGDTSCPAGSAAGTPCLADVVGSVKQLEPKGEVLGFWWNPVHPRPSGLGRHWQGIQRLFVPGEGLDGRLLVVSSNHADRARLALIRLNSRNGDGLRFGSNRVAPGRDAGGVPPPIQDRIVGSVEVSEDYRHPGGLYAVGAYLLVPLEKGNGVTERGAVACFRFSGQRLVKVWEIPALTSGAAAVAATRLDTGDYLMVIGGKGTKRLDFLLSRSGSLDEPEWQHLAEWHAGEARSNLGGADIRPQRVWDRYQSLSLMTECESGALYLLGFSGPILPGLTIVDWIDVFRLRLTRAGTVELVKVAQQKVYAREGAGSRQSHFRAAAGAYVDPHHRLFVYATERGIGGPLGSIKMMEFGPPEAGIAGLP